MGLDKASGLSIGRGTPGPRNLITDVPGVTAIKPHGGNLFQDKVMAAHH